ncbi:DUF2975 domain-containing protein [Streptomyces sp. NBC_01429]|uniref:DUF2975 domain-containing protein n=1 Tax=Streptomyces sp. NBC_01429 TaxID=2903862 RepID=UPI002E2AF89A|nr:DUF2975 domain-containing protein [Streptomyces sp. NBC_01429]
MNTSPWYRVEWDRGDNTALRVVLGVGAALVAGFAVLSPLLGVLGVTGQDGAGRTVPLRGAATVAGSGGGDGIALNGTSQGEVTFAHPDLAQRALLALPEFFSGVLLLIVAYLLYRIVRTLAAGDPFVPDNARRVRAIAVTVLGLAILRPLLDMITTGQLVLGTAVEDQVSVEATFSSGPVLLGLLIAALAEVFRRGTQLRADAEGLV